MPNFRYHTPAQVTCTAGATTFVLGGTADAGEPQDLDELDLGFDESLASDKGMLVELAQWDTQGTSGSDTDAQWDDRVGVTRAAPDGQYNMTGSTTAIPNTNKVFLESWHLHPSEKLFRYKLRTEDGGRVIIPGGKTWAISVNNPAGNSSPKAVGGIRGRV